MTVKNKKYFFKGNKDLQQFRIMNKSKFYKDSLHYKDSINLSLLSYSKNLKTYRRLCKIRYNKNFKLNC